MPLSKNGMEIVDAAADAGAHAIKSQTYTADTMTLDLAENEFLVSDPNSLWYERDIYELYNEVHTHLDWQPRL